ncbi:MAG: hypothetical protein ABI857_05035 [Acidobacteriota bacterium]
MKKRTPEEKLLNPRPGGNIAAASEYGIDLTQIVENLRLTPAERIKANDQAVNSVLRFEEAMRRAKAAKKTKAL